MIGPVAWDAFLRTERVPAVQDMNEQLGAGRLDGIGKQGSSCSTYARSHREGLTATDLALSVGTCTTRELDSSPERAANVPGASAKACEAPHGDDDWCHYVVIRKDLTTGQKCAQSVHAAGESSPFRVPPNTAAIVLGADNAEHLLEVRRELALAQITHVLILECDGEPMAIGLEPTRDRKRIRKVLSKLPLLT